MFVCCASGFQTADAIRLSGFPHVIARVVAQRLGIPEHLYVSVSEDDPSRAPEDCETPRFVSAESCEQFLSKFRDADRAEEASTFFRENRDFLLHHLFLRPLAVSRKTVDQFRELFPDVDVDPLETDGSLGWVASLITKGSVPLLETVLGDILSDDLGRDVLCDLFFSHPTMVHELCRRPLYPLLHQILADEKLKKVVMDVAIIQRDSSGQLPYDYVRIDESDHSDHLFGEISDCRDLLQATEEALSSTFQDLVIPEIPEDASLIEDFQQPPRRSPRRRPRTSGGRRRRRVRPRSPPYSPSFSPTKLLGRVEKEALQVHSLVDESIPEYPLTPIGNLQTHPGDGEVLLLKYSQQPKYMWSVEVSRLRAIRRNILRSAPISLFNAQFIVKAYFRRPKNGRPALCLFLHVVPDPDSDADDVSIRIQWSFSVLNQGALLTDAVLLFGEAEFTERHPSWGYRGLIERRKILSQSAGYIFEDDTVCFEFVVKGIEWSKQPS